MLSHSEFGSPVEVAVLAIREVRCCASFRSLHRHRHNPKSFTAVGNGSTGIYGSCRWLHKGGAPLVPSYKTSRHRPRDCGPSCRRFCSHVHRARVVDPDIPNIRAGHFPGTTGIGTGLAAHRPDTPSRTRNAEHGAIGILTGTMGITFSVAYPSIWRWTRLPSTITDANPRSCPSRLSGTRTPTGNLVAENSHVRTRGMPKWTNFNQDRPCRGDSNHTTFAEPLLLSATSEEDQGSRRQVGEGESREDPSHVRTNIEAPQAMPAWGGSQDCSH